MSDSNVHDIHGLPIVLIGGGSGRLKGGRHVTYAPGTPLTNLYLTILNTLGVPVERIGDSNGQLEHLSGI
jgi:hypothetical protein